MVVETVILRRIYPSPELPVRNTILFVFGDTGIEEIGIWRGVHGADEDLVVEPWILRRKYPIPDLEGRARSR